jgi:hypothetical protein
MFCCDFSFLWNEIACKDDDKLVQRARRTKRDILELVSSVG